MVPSGLLDRRLLEAENRVLGYMLQTWEVSNLAFGYMATIMTNCIANKFYNYFQTSVCKYLVWHSSSNWGLGIWKCYFTFYCTLTTNNKYCSKVIHFLQLERFFLGLQWGEFFATPSTDSTRFVFGHVVLMLSLDCVLYMLIALYLEKVFPGSYGTPHKWYFPFQKKFWCPIKEAHCKFINFCFTFINLSHFLKLILYCLYSILIKYRGFNFYFFQCITSCVQKLSLTYLMHISIVFFNIM